MAEGVDYYDVQNMIRDARSEIRGEIDRELRTMAEQLRAEMHDAIASLQRVLDARTGDHV